MLRLSRQSWNNLIIFGVLALFFLFYIAPSHLAFMLSRDAAVTMLAPGQRILQLQFPKATLKQAGPVWRFEPQHSAIAPEILLQQWQQFVLPAPQQAGNQILAQVCQVQLYQSGEAAPTLWQLVLDQQQWYLQTQQWLFPVTKATADQLCPPSLR